MDGSELTKPLRGKNLAVHVLVESKMSGGTIMAPNISTGSSSHQLAHLFHHNIDKFSTRNLCPRSIEYEELSTEEEEDAYVSSLSYGAP